MSVAHFIQAKVATFWRAAKSKHENPFTGFKESVTIPLGTEGKTVSDQLRQRNLKRRGSLLRRILQRIACQDFYVGQHPECGFKRHIIWGQGPGEGEAEVPTFSGGADPR